MGMTIDDCIKMLIAKEKCMKRETSGIDTDCNLHNCDNCSLCYEQGTMSEQEEALKFAVETMRKYQQLQADYENRLKADLKAILVELQLQMEEYEPKWVENDEQAVASCRTWEDLDGIIQNKINTLEE